MSFIGIKINDHITCRVTYVLHLDCIHVHVHKPKLIQCHVFNADLESPEGVEKVLTLLFGLKPLWQRHSEVVEYSLKVESQEILLGSLKEIARSNYE